MKGAHMTKEQLKKCAAAILNQEVIAELEGEPKQKRSKYGNEKVEVDGEVFDSKKEANRWGELRLLLKAGEIGLLRRQVKYELNPNGTHSLAYKADFVYMVVKTGETIVEDAKGFRTREYKKKRRLMKKVHGIIIKEI
jgi:hypothetical protein